MPNIFSVSMSELPYRQNVAIVVVNREGLILACRRSDAYQAWQLPQGGIEAGEEPEEAMWRELEEEIKLRQERSPR